MSQENDLSGSTEDAVSPVPDSPPVLEPNLRVLVYLENTTLTLLGLEIHAFADSPPSA